MNDKIPFEELQFGFRYGGATITRAFSDKKKGWVVMSIETQKEELQIYVTKTGKVRIHSDEGEWKPLDTPLRKPKMAAEAKPSNRDTTHPTVE